MVFCEGEEERGRRRADDLVSVSLLSWTMATPVVRRARESHLREDSRLLKAKEPMIAVVSILDWYETW